LKFIFFFFILLNSCSENAVKRQFIQAEKLWSQGYYQASVKELESLLRREGQNENDPIVTQALYRAGITQTLYLHQHEEALQKFEEFLKRNITDDQKKMVLLEMGEILFSRLKSYERAYNHYDHLDESLLTAKEVDFVKIRKARCMHFLWKFDQAISILEPYLNNKDESKNEKIILELGNVYLTYSRSPQISDKKILELNNKSIQIFSEFIEKFKNSINFAEAVIGLATAYEQLDQLEKALLVLSDAEKINPKNLRLIQLKKDRITERIQRRKR